MSREKHCIKAFRRSRPEVFCKKGVLKNFSKFIGKHLCHSLFSNKVAGLRHKCFPVNFAKFIRTLFLRYTSGRLLLGITVLMKESQTKTKANK